MGSGLNEPGEIFSWDTCDLGMAKRKICLTLFVIMPYWQGRYSVGKCVELHHISGFIWVKC